MGIEGGVFTNLKLNELVIRSLPLLTSMYRIRVKLYV
jgi:hypothetical protein